MAGQTMPADGYTTYLLLLLCAGDVMNARYVYKRMPTEYRKNTVLKAVHAVFVTTGTCSRIVRQDQAAFVK